MAELPEGWHWMELYNGTYATNHLLCNNGYVMASIDTHSDIYVVWVSNISDAPTTYAEMHKRIRHLPVSDLSLGEVKDMTIEMLCTQRLGVL